MVPLRPLSLAAAITAAVFFSPPAAAQPPIPGARHPGGVAAPNPAILLEQSREALSKLTALSYKGVATGEGDKVPSYTANITMARAEAGGWKLYITGTAGAPDAKDAPAFEIGYDGVIARSLREKDKVVVEKAATDMTELAVFFSSQSAKHPVAWELLDDNPFAGSANAIYEGTGDVAGVPCDIIMIPSAPPPATKVGDGEANPNAAESMSGVRVYLATDDHLPRRIDRIRAGGPAAGAPGDDAVAGGDGGDGGGGKATRFVRTLILSDIKTDADVAGAPFALSVPDGFRVSTPQTKPLAKAGQDGKRAAPARPSPADRAPLAVGAEAPDFTLKDAAGKEHRLADYKGKVVFLDFWATWCPPCIAAMPAVQRLHETFKGRPVVVFGVNMNDREDPVAYMRKQKFDYGLLLNGEKIADQYKITGIPAFFIIGPDGKILWSGSGYPSRRAEAAAHDAKVIAIIEKALAGGEK